MLIYYITCSHHYKSCTRMPANVRAAIEQAKTQPGRKRQSKSNSKDYWSQSAREAGLVDDQGIFFAAEAEENEPEAEAEENEAEVEEEEEQTGVGEEDVEQVQEAAAVDAADAEPLPFDSIALFDGPGLGLIDDNEDDDQHRQDHQEAIIAAEKPHKVDEQEAVQECMYPSSSAPAPAPAPAPVHVAPHHSTTSEADDDAMLHEALAILSDDAEDEVGSEDGSNNFEPLPMKEDLQSTYSDQQQQQQYSTGILSEGSAPDHPTSWHGSRGPAYTRGQHSLAYASGLLSSDHHLQQQPRRHSTMGSISYRTAAEQQQYQPRRFSLAGAVSPDRSYHYDQAAKDQQGQHMLSYHNHPTLTSESDKVAPMIPFSSPIQRVPSAPSAQGPAPLSMPLPLPSSAMVPPATTLMNYQGAKRRSSVVSSTSSASGCNSPAMASTPSTSRSSSYGFVTSASSTAIVEETMVFPAATAVEPSNKRARYE